MRRPICIAACVASIAARAEAQVIPPLVEPPAESARCLTLAIAYEAGYESLAGQRAIAEVVLNRLRDAAFPKTVCGVVFAGSGRPTGCQFTFTCDGSLVRRKLPTRILQAARVIADEALAGRAPSVVPGATHYHAEYVHPYWAPTLVRLTRIGAHIFYQRGTGTPAAVPVPAPETQAPAPPFAPWGLTLASAPVRP